MVVDPYVLSSPVSYSEFEAILKGDISRLLSERQYAGQDISEILIAFDTAAEIHRCYDERRKVPKPFWEGNAGGEPYLSHIARVLNFMLIEPAFDYRLDPILLSSACLHDTLETLTEKEPEKFPEKECALDFVMSQLNMNLSGAGLKGQSSSSPEIKNIIHSLSRNHDDVYYQSIGQVFSLEPDNLVRALVIKGFDRMDNSIDLQDLSLYSDYWKSRQWPEIFHDMKKTLKSFFKTLYVANETKRYIVEKNPPNTQLSSNLRQMPRVIAMNMKLVYEIISDALKEYALAQPGQKGAKLHDEILQAKQEMADYLLNGGFDRVTSEGELHSIYDGTIRKYDRILRKESGTQTYSPSPLEIYRDARSIQTLLFLLFQPDRPDYYLKGF